MTARTLPITPRGGLTLVHQPTRSTLGLPAATVGMLRSMTKRLAAWWRRTSSLEMHREERDRLRRTGFPLYPEPYTWLPRPAHPGGRHDW